MRVMVYLDDSRPGVTVAVTEHTVAKGDAECAAAEALHAAHRDGCTCGAHDCRFRIERISPYWHRVTIEHAAGCSARKP